MRILLVEDDHFQGARVSAELDRMFSGSKVEWIKTELDFRKSIDKIAENPPDVVIMDVMLRWTVPSEDMNLPPADVLGGFFLAGFRCEKELAEREATKDIPVILYTILERGDLKDKLKNMRPNVVFLRKKSDLRPLFQRIHDVKSVRKDQTVRVTFELKGYPDASVVALTGSFNGWSRSKTLFTKEGERWVCHVDLKPGTYFYKFIVDGRWMTDPANPNTEYDTNKNLNSVIVVD